MKSSIQYENKNKRTRGGSQKQNTVMVDLDNVRVDIDYKNHDGENVGEALKRLEFQRQERLNLVPTLKEDVIHALELLGQPSYIDKEDDYARRDRLADIILKSDEARDKIVKYMSSTSDTHIEDKHSITDEEEFYTPASENLIAFRKFLILFSLNRAKLRVKNERRQLSTQSVKDVISKRRRLECNLKKYSLNGTKVVDEKPVSEIRSSSNGEFIACGSWSGNLSIFKTSMEKAYVNKALEGTKISGLDWSADGRNIVVCTYDGKIAMYDTSSENTVDILHSNNARFAKIRYHPCNNVVGSTSFDKTWVLFDTEKKAVLLKQEGHANEVFSLVFNTDGSLACTGGLDSVALVWDLRSGKTIMSLQGHSKPIYSLDWAKNGYQLASGSGDGTIKIWDIRKKEKAETILAHNSLVSQVSFSRDGSDFLVSSGYDKKVNIFNGGNWIKEKTLEGHLDKVMSVDIVNSDIYSAGWDRSLNKWSF